jgi:integrase
MASIDKRTGEWRVRWRDPDGKARSRQCPTKAAAQALVREVEDAVALGRRWEPRDARPQADLRALLKDYAEECARVLRPGTAVRYALGLDLLLRYLEKVHGKGAPLPPSVLTRRMLADWYGDLKHGGLHGRDRSEATRRKIVEVGQLAWKWLYDNDETGAEIPMPRTLRMAREAAKPTVAPTWAEMDTVIASLKGWHQRLAIVLRFTGLRCQQAMGLKWSDIDLARSRLTVRGELGKSRQEQRGRIIPISPFLVALLKTWERDDEWLITAGRTGDRKRMARARDLERGWERSGVRKEAWEGRPHHAFRKGFVSELKRAGADPDAVEFLVGHSLGLRGVYIDADALPLQAAIDRIPVLGTQAAGDQARIDGALRDGPLRLITLDESERDPGLSPGSRRDPVCPERVPAGRGGRNNVLSLDAFRRSGGGGGSRTQRLANPTPPTLTAATFRPTSAEILRK